MSYRDDERDQIWEKRADRAYSSVTYHPWRWVWGAIGGVILLAIVIAVISWIGSWGGEAARITGPQNTREQVTAVLGDWTAMQATACNVLQVKDSKTNSDSPTLVEDPALAYSATYRRTKADYDRRMNNLFEAYVTRRMPLPGSIRNYPQVAPGLHAMTVRVKQDESC